MTEEEIKATRENYILKLEPLFLPPNPNKQNIINYFASLLRIVGMEDRGWDPHLESRAILEDLNAILQMNLSTESFSDQNWTKWRLGLIMYSHIVEMDAPYEVLANLLRFQTGKGYSPNPFLMFLKEKEKIKAIKFGLSPLKKIEIIKKLSAEANLSIGEIFDDFYNPELRNAISHSDFILTNDGFRSRGQNINPQLLSIPLDELNIFLVKARIFMSTFYTLEYKTRKDWGTQKNKAIHYDPHYKALIEFLVDDENLMCGFKIHWPNNSESFYKRTKDGIDMCNCEIDLNRSTISFEPGIRPHQPSEFSPLIEKGTIPKYTEIENGKIPTWN